MTKTVKGARPAPLKAPLSSARLPKTKNSGNVISPKVDQTADKTGALEAELLATRHYAEAIVDETGPLLVLEPNLQVRTANRSFCECFKIESRQALGRRIYDLGNGQWDIPELRVLLEKILPQKSFFKNFEVTHRFEHIGTRTMLLNGRQLDHIQCILLFVEDITERRNAQLALTNTEIRYRRLFEAARDGILIVDPDTRKITDSNPFMSELLGYSHKELIGRELWEIGLVKDEKSSQKAFAALQKDHFIRYENLPLRNKRGGRHEVEFVSNLYDENGRQVIQCNIRDITERKRIARALVNAKNTAARHARELEQIVADRTSELRETISELEGFSYSVSHDMRAPLRAMQSFASYLIDEYQSKLDAQGINYIQQIMRSAVRLDRLIQDVLSYTRIIHSKPPVDRVDLDRLARDIIETFPNGQALKPEFQIEGTLPPVMGSDALVAQCINNLLANSAKFVSPGIVPRVEISAETVAGGDVRIWFKDNGIGISRENHARIFRLFERIHSAAEFEGTGIGLTIVRKAIDRMGGSLGVESEPGKGSKFWFQLRQA